MKKTLWIGLPLLILVVLVGWRYQSNRQAAGAQAQQSGQRRGAAPTVELAIAGPKTIITTIETVGSAESPFRVELAPKISGRIESLTVREGDSVRKGDVLVRIDPAEQRSLVLQMEANLAEARSRLAQAQLGQIPNSTGIEAAIEQRRADLTSAKADLQQVQRNYDALVASADADVTDAEARKRSSESRVENAAAELNRQNANLKSAKSRLDRAESLYKEGFTSLQALEDARTAYEVQLSNVEVAKGQASSARNDVQSATAQLKSANSQAQIARRKGTADIESAKANVAKAESALKSAVANRAQNPAYAQNLAALKAGVQAAEAQVNQARTRLQDLALTSPIDGTVTRRNADPGSIASPGSPVLELQSLDWLYVVGSLPMEEAGKVRTGQEVQLQFDALPDEMFTGRIAQINSAADVQSRQFGIRVRLENARRRVKPGMLGRIGIVASRVGAAVTVPREAVKTTPAGKSTVTVVDEENKASIREVTVGAGDKLVVQILSGVSVGEKVVRLSFSQVREGQQVRPPEAKGERKGP